ncbi:hypothetical protein ACFLYF_02425 [Chloroflexota bacterium]
MPQLPEMVEALLNPAIYPEATQQVQLMQTQMSFVFIAGDYVYKTKKPVNLGYLDYRTLEQRHYFCRREVELNRRLCPDVYLDVVTVNDDNGVFSLNGKGEIKDYAVKMRHLPPAAMMDNLLPQNRVTPEMVTGVARKLAEFHAKAETSAEISRFGGLDTVRQNTEENFTQTENKIGNTITQEAFRRIKDYTDNFVNGNTALFQKRVDNGRIRDCHGDLHAAHICFTDDIYIYDCIEFNDRFRYCDVASEIAFLSMDLDRYGRNDLSLVFTDAYIGLSQDRDIRELLGFYKCYRAYVRGKVEGFKLDDPHIAEDEKARVLTIARRYFELAESYIP